MDVELGIYNNLSHAINKDFKNLKLQLLGDAQSTCESTYQFINVSNLKFNSTWACICEIKFHMAFIIDYVIV